MDKVTYYGFIFAPQIKRGGPSVGGGLFITSDLHVYAEVYAGVTPLFAMYRGATERPEETLTGLHAVLDVGYGNLFQEHELREGPFKGFYGEGSQRVQPRPGGIPSAGFMAGLEIGNFGRATPPKHSIFEENGNTHPPSNEKSAKQNTGLSGVPKNKSIVRPVGVSSSPTNKQKKDVRPGSNNTSSTKPSNDVSYKITRAKQSSSEENTSSQYDSNEVDASTSSQSDVGTGGSKEKTDENDQTQDQYNPTGL